MVEIYRMDENDDKRSRQTADEHLWDDPGTEDFDNDELGYFGIVVRRRTASTCPYNAAGEYVPRGLR